MYEHAMRLGQEVSGLDSLQKQVIFIYLYTFFATLHITKYKSKYRFSNRRLKERQET